MTLQDYLRVLREQWIICMIGALLGLAAAGGVFILKPATYTAKLTMYVSAQGGDTTQAAFQGAQLSQDRVTSYTQLVSNVRISRDVITQLGLSETPQELSKHIIATSAIDSVIIEVSVDDPSPDRAAQLANVVGQVMTSLVAELERPIQIGGEPAVALRVVQPAEIPDKPSSTGLPLILAVGLLGGVILGVGAALARNTLDNSVKSLEQLRACVGAPNLGTIAYDPQVPKHPLTVQEDPHSPRSEAFRQIRTNLQFVDVDNPHKVIVITSSMPGEGKTTTLVNLAIAMASAGTRVLVIDADLRRPKVAELLGLDRSVGLTGVLSGRDRPAHTIQPWGGGMFDVLASGPLPPNPSELLASRHMAMLLQNVREQYDLVLVDSPPLLPVTDAAAVAPAADGVILACRYKETSRSQVTTAAQALASVSTRILGTVFTMVPSSGPRAYAQYNAYYLPEAIVPPISSRTDGGSNGYHPQLGASPASRDL